jgi:hypothetical protein
MVFQTSMPSYRFVYHLYPSFLNMYRGEKLCVYQYGGYLFGLMCLSIWRVSIWIDVFINMEGQYGGYLFGLMCLSIWRVSIWIDVFINMEGIYLD